MSKGITAATNGKEARGAVGTRARRVANKLRREMGSLLADAEDVVFSVPDERKRREVWSVIHASFADASTCVTRFERSASLEPSNWNDDDLVFAQDSLRTILDQVCHVHAGVLSREAAASLEAVMARVRSSCAEATALAEELVAVAHEALETAAGHSAAEAAHA